MLRTLLTIVLVLAACPASRAHAQVTVYLNATVYTADDDNPRAQAIAVEGDRIVGVGSAAEMLEGRSRRARVVDLRRQTVIPGIIDAHGHLSGLGQLRTGVIDLSGTGSYDEVVGLIVERAATVEPGTWIIGRGWDHESWSSRQLPHHRGLSDAVPEHPVWLRRVDGHAALANARAMEAAGVDASAESPQGGEVMREDGGVPTGVFVDNAMGLVGSAVPPGASGQTRDLLLAAQEMCFEAGLTGVHDMGVSPDQIRIMRRMADAGELKLRINAVLHGRAAMKYFEAEGITVGDRVTARSCKLYIDGAMGSRGAWLLEAYSDRPVDDESEAYTGLSVTEPGFVEAVARHAIEHGYQVCTHAIGDRGNREVLDAYQRAGVGPEHRFRVEHAQVVHPDDLPRFASMGVIASMQPTHCVSDMRWVEDRVGPDRLGGAYAWSTIIDSGAVLAGGSDFPVESHNPLLGFAAAVTRQNADMEPEGGWRPGERMTREEALRSMTLWAATASFDEADRGSIEVGKLADFVVLDRDIMTCPPERIRGTSVVRTVIGGETVHEAPREDGARRP